MRNKKAQAFVLIAILIASMIIISFSVYFVFNDRKVVNERVKTMDSFLFSLEEDLVRQMYIVGYRGLFLAEVEVTNTGEYIENISNFFSSAFFNSVPYDSFCNESNINISAMCGVRYADLIQSIEDKGDSMNLNLNISHPAISIYQYDPWNVAINFQFNLTMDDESGLARWDKRENITSLISIEGFEDPLYIIETNARVPVKINKTSYEGIYVVSESVSNLKSHLYSSMYTSTPFAPSFLMRLQGMTGADAEGKGIESLVDVSSLPAVYRKTDRTVVDYLYFNPSPISGSQIQGMPSWFKIDSPHLSTYNVTDLII